ncbi:MAG: S-methyl-5-thioribose-1-phosphate isomerase [Haliscomenobacter sp.]|nr:S-methyl-5-thioribose-1-phosphate isomerase [Haliscomenobacter sp.]
MKINGVSYRTIWTEGDLPEEVFTFDQRLFPFELKKAVLRTSEDAALAIEQMLVRGAPLIGATAAFGFYLAAREAPEGEGGWVYLQERAARLRQTRPTAVDLFHAIDLSVRATAPARTQADRIRRALQAALDFANQSAEQCWLIGQHGLGLIREISERKPGQAVNILTHCNAGWLACIDYGTATAPIYAAHDLGIPVHVWVDETRPRNQGSKITAFELGQHGVPHTVIPDNTGGHLMQHGMVDLVLVGTDRTTREGDVANKIGTYLKALAAKDNGVPFYVGLPSSSLDFSLGNGLVEIPIEERSEAEVKYFWGMENGQIRQVLTMPEESKAANYGFDVTPARLVTGLITERGICPASEGGILSLFPERSLKKTP